MPRIRPEVIGAAIGLSARWFPTGSLDGVIFTARRHVCFVLDGHLDAWSGWPGLSDHHARQFGQLLRRRPNQLANAETAGPILDTLLMAGMLPGAAPAADYADTGTIVVTPGMPLDDFIDANLTALHDLHAAADRCLPPATAGPHHTSLRIVGPDGTPQKVIDVRYLIEEHHTVSRIANHGPGTASAGGLVAPPVMAAPILSEIRVPLVELRRIAERLDAADGESSTGYRTRCVRRFIAQLRSPTANTISDGSGTGADACGPAAPVIELDLTAGMLNELIAYTGFGKSVVLIEVLGCWLAQRGLVVTFAVPTNTDVVRNAWRLERSLAALEVPATVAPLMSPRSVFKVAETLAHRAPDVAAHPDVADSPDTAASGPDADWIWTRLGYGCALAAAGITDTRVDTWQPGDEPCAKLSAPPRGRGRKDRTVACPWRQVCGKFGLARAALDANIIITSHANLQEGRVYLPVDDGDGVTDRMSVEELVLRRSHLLVIDEVDSFQQAAINRSGRGLVLDRGGSTTTPLRRFDEEFGGAFGRVHAEVDATVRDALVQTRYLSENYVSHLAYARLGTSPSRQDRTSGPRRTWVVPRRWDSWLTARLFRLATDEEITPAQLYLLRTLFPGEVPLLAELTPLEPDVFAQIRPHMGAVVTAGVGGTAIATGRAELDHLLVGTVSDPDERHTVISRLLRRAILEQVRVCLHRLMANTPQLLAAGVQSTQEIADALGPYGRWRVTPTGPLGRLVFAFTEYHDDTGTEPTRLTTAAFGGDPHVYTISLGDTTALAHAGNRRIVLGLSATSYFPGAPHFHVHTRPRWWVTDDNPGSVTIRSTPIHTDNAGAIAPASDRAGDRPRRRAGDGDRQLIRVSGLKLHRRAEATQQLTKLLWVRKLDAELARLTTDDPSRARILLATTSYEAGRHVAEGLSAAGVAKSRICLAVRPRPDAPHNVPHRRDRQLVTDTGRWMELPADRIEEFPAVPGADILIAPLGRVQRGVNLIGEGDKSALGSVWLIIRPIPIIDEPAELLAHIQAKALTDHPGPTPSANGDPLDTLAERRTTAGQYVEEIVRRPPFFQAQPAEVKLGVVAEIINGAIQLIGRARRGGTPAVLHLVDGAFLDPGGGTDFATLIRHLRDHWKRIGVLERMHQLYGTTLEAFFTYADIRTAGDSSGSSAGDAAAGDADGPEKPPIPTATGDSPC